MTSLRMLYLWPWSKFQGNKFELVSLKRWELAQKNASNDIFRYRYSPSNDIIVNIVFRDLDLNFQDQNFEISITFKLWEQKCVIWLSQRLIFCFCFTYWNNLNTATRTERNKNWYGKTLRANMVSRTGRNKKWVREDIYNVYRFPYLKNLNSTGTGSRTGRSKRRVREDIESEYGFRYWNK